MSAPFTNHGDAARALLNTAPLKPKEGQFSGGLAFEANPMTEKQAHWLAILFEKHGLAPMAEGGGA